MRSILIILPYFLNLFVIFITRPFWWFGQKIFLFLGIFLIILGGFIWLISALELGSNYHLYKIPPKLITTGIYKKIRHPIYFGSTLLFLGIVIFYGSFWGLIYLFCITIPYQFLRAIYEEKQLIKKFGQKYLDYKKTTLF